MRSLSRSFVVCLFLVWTQRAQAAEPQEILARAKEASGDVTLSDSGDDREGAANEAWRRSLSYWYPDRRQGEIADEGERREGERTFHVLRITPTGGRPFEMWIDTAGRPRSCRSPTRARSSRARQVPKCSCG